MKRTFTCPHCHGVLNPGTKIVLRGERAGRAGLILLSPQPGNYDAIIPEGFPLKEKDKVDFFCPLCGKDLVAPREASMARLSFRIGSASGTVAFSRVYGKHSTYVITEESVRSYGEHATPDAVNYWGAGPED
jgi:hypothetical protein